MYPMPSGITLSLTGGSVTMASEIADFTGSARRGRTTETFTTDPGGPVSRPSISASDMSRVDFPSIASMMSPLAMSALSAGPPGMTEITAA